MKLRWEGNGPVYIASIGLGPSRMSSLGVYRIKAFDPQVPLPRANTS